MSRVSCLVFRENLTGCDATFRPIAGYPTHLATDADRADEHQDGNGTLLVTSPDFPELTTFGEDRDDALARAIDAFDEAIAARIARREDVPRPSKGRVRVALRTMTAVKLILYQGMRDQGIGKAELARRLHWHLPQVDRVLDIQHQSRLDQIDAALGAIGLRLHVNV